jgi:hypothetical protein
VTRGRDPDEYLDPHDETDERIGDDTAWPLDGFDPDDREPAGGDPYWAEDLWD